MLWRFALPSPIPHSALRNRLVSLDIGHLALVILSPPPQTGNQPTAPAPDGICRKSAHPVFLCTLTHCLTIITQHITAVKPGRDYILDKPNTAMYFAMYENESIGF
jgi:hypothetical protein